MISAAANLSRDAFPVDVHRANPKRDSRTGAARRCDRVGHDASWVAGGDFVSARGRMLAQRRGIAQGLLKIAGNAARCSVRRVRASMLESNALGLNSLLRGSRTSGQHQAQHQLSHIVPLVLGSPAPLLGGLSEGILPDFAPPASRAFLFSIAAIRDVVPSLGEQPLAGEVSPPLDAAPAFASAGFHAGRLRPFLWGYVKSC